MIQGRQVTQPGSSMQAINTIAVGMTAAGMLWLLAVSRVVADEQPKVTITGGADVTGHNYEWTVTNNYHSPVVYIEFPHYHADLFFAPDGWITRSTYLVNPGVPDRPGVCTATAETAANGIRQGGSAEFRMRIGIAGARRGPGEVLVRFADGSKVKVSGVQLPHPKDTPIDKYVRVIGFFLIGVVAIVILSIRQRRRFAHDSLAGSPTSDDS